MKLTRRQLRRIILNEIKIVNESKSIDAVIEAFAGSFAIAASCKLDDKTGTVLIFKSGQDLETIMTGLKSSGFKLKSLDEKKKEEIELVEDSDIKTTKGETITEDEFQKALEVTRNKVFFVTQKS